MKAQKKSAKQNEPWYKKWWAITLMVIFVGPVALATVFGIIAGVQETSKNPSSNQPNNNQRATASYIQPDWEITNTETVGTKYVVASGYLINRTGESGVAECIIEFYDRETKWAGGKGFGGRELKPNERYGFTIQVEVEHVGLVAKQNIYCEDGVY
jgi:hypothetical protein